MGRRHGVYITTEEAQKKYGNSGNGGGNGGAGGNGGGGNGSTNQQTQAAEHNAVTSNLTDYLAGLAIDATPEQKAAKTEATSALISQITSEEGKEAIQKQETLAQNSQSALDSVLGKTPEPATRPAFFMDFTPEQIEAMDAPKQEERRRIAAEEAQKRKQEQIDTRASEIRQEIKDLDANAGYITTTEQNDAYQLKRNELNNELLSLGKDIEKSTARDITDRTWATIQSGLAGTIAGNTDAQRALYEGGQKARSRETQEQIDYWTAQKEEHERMLEYALENSGADSIDADYARNVLEHDKMMLSSYGQVDEAQKGATRETAELADTASEFAAEKTAEAQEGASQFGKFLVNVGTTATQMAADAASNLFLGMPGSKLPLISRAFGSATQEARQAGASIEQQVGYGSVIAGIETATEMMFDGLAGLYGGGAADDIVEGWLTKLAGESNSYKKMILRSVFSGLGEGTEEGTSDFLNPFAKLIYDGGEALKEKYGSKEGYLSSLKDTGYDFLLGFATGVCGGSIENLQSVGETTISPELQMAFEAGKQAAADNPQIANITASQIVRNEDARAAFLQSHPDVVLPESNTAAERIVAQTLYNDSRNAKDSAETAQIEKEQPAVQQTVPAAPQVEQTAPVQTEQTPAQYTPEQNRVIDILTNPKGVTPAQAGEIARTPALRQAYEALTDTVLPESTNKAKTEIMNTDLADIQDADVINAPDINGSVVSSDSSVSNPTTVKVGQATTIQSPYSGTTPQNTPNAIRETPEISVDSISNAKSNIEIARESDTSGGKSFKSKLKEIYKSLFGETRTVTVLGVTFDNGQYDVSVGKRAVGKVVNDPNLSAEKLAVLENIDGIIQNAEYVGSGEYNKNNPNSQAQRYDYFETNIKINGVDYIVTFDVEVLPSLNQYRTHKVINKIDLQEITESGPGPAPGVTVKPSSLDASVSQRNNVVNTNQQASASYTPVDALASNATEAQNSPVSATQESTPEISQPTPQNSSTEVKLGENDARTATTAEQTATVSAVEESEQGKTPFVPKVNPNPKTVSEKRSRTESNTLQSVAAQNGGEQAPLTYTPITENQTLMAAAARVNANMPAEMTNLASKGMWTAEDVDTALTIYSRLQANGLKTGDFSAAAAWGIELKNHGSSNAQALQAYAKWSRTGSAIAIDASSAISESSRLTEEQKSTITNDVYDFGVRFDSAVESGSIDDITQLIKDQSDYRNTGTLKKENFGKILDEIRQRIGDDAYREYAQEYAARQLMAIPNDYTQDVSLGQKLKTWQVNSQLSRLPTFNRNIGGNIGFGIQDTLAQNSFGIAVDWALSKATGKREVGFDKSWFSSKAREAARTSMLQSILEVSGDVDMSGETSRYGTTSSRTFKMSSDSRFERFMSRWEQILGYSLTTSDKTSRGQIEASIKESIDNINGNVDIDEDAADALAKSVADYRLFQNSGIATKVSKGIHDVFNVIGTGGELKGVTRQGGFGLGDLINAYPGVPANLAVKIAEYSPANAVKGVYEVFKMMNDAKMGEDVSGKQYQAAMDIARGLSGVPLIVALTALFKSGAAKNADDEDDYDVMNQMAAEGRTGVQINLSAIGRGLDNDEAVEWKSGDNLMSIGWLEPLNGFMAIASLIADDNNEKSFSQNYINGAIQSILDMPVLENIANFFDTINYSTADTGAEKFGEAALDFAGDAVSGMLPAPLFSQLAKATDDSFRDTKGSTKLETVINGILSNIPGARQTLNPTLDNFGEDKKYSGTDFQRFLNTYVLPGAVNKFEQTEVSNAYESVYNETNDSSVYPDRKAPNYLTGADGKRIDLSQDEKTVYQQTRGTNISELANGFINSDDYASLSASEKAAVLKEINGYGDYLAKKEYFENSGTDWNGSSYSKYDEFDDPVSAMIQDSKWDPALNKKSRDFDAIDALISGIGKLDDETREYVEGKDYVKGLEAAAEHGVGAKDFFEIKDVVKDITDKDGKIDYSAVDALVSNTLGDIEVEDIKEIGDAVNYSWLDEMAAAKRESGIDSKTWLGMKEEFDRIDDEATAHNAEVSDSGEGERITENDKNAQFHSYVDGLAKDGTLTAEQAQFIKENQFVNWSMYSVSETKYDPLFKATGDKELSLKWYDNLSNLEPLEGKSSVSGDQKAEVILTDTSVSAETRLDAMLEANIIPTQKYLSRWLARSGLSNSMIHSYWSKICTQYEWKTSYEKALKKK